MSIRWLLFRGSLGLEILSLLLLLLLLQVNDREMKGVTREEAFLYLQSLQDRIDLIVQYRRDEYDSIVESQRGDSFYVR